MHGKNAPDNVVAWEPPFEYRIATPRILEVFSKVDFKSLGVKPFFCGELALVLSAHIRAIRG
jgi:hypothetical protein